VLSRGQRVLITGGAGLIGSHIVDLLVDGQTGFACQEIIVLDNLVRGQRDNLRPAISHGPVTLIEGDVRDQKLVADIMQGVDVVFHQAALRITQCAAEPRLALEILVGGTFNVLEAAVQAGVQKVVAASSASIYGMADVFPTSESHHPYHNRTLYGAAKTFNEGLLRSFYDMYGLNYVALRYFNVYGPRMDLHGAYTEVFIRWMERIAAGLPPVIFGDGTQTMDFIYVSDVARANIMAAQAPITDEVCNVARGVETRLDELANALLKTMGVDLELEYGPERKVNPVPRRLANTIKAKHLLGFEAQVPLEEGLRHLVYWWQQERLKAQASPQVC
jgi:UDP-glucose 4-epimerase